MNQAMPTHLEWEAYRRDFQWCPGGEHLWHEQHLAYPSADLGSLSAGLIVVPSGHRTRLGPRPQPIFMVGVDKAVDIQYAETTAHLRKFDIVKVPASTAFTVTNPAARPRAVFMVSAAPDGESSLVDDERGINHFRWREERNNTQWDRLPHSADWGRHRTSYRNMKASGILMHIGRTPMGQGGPPHSVPANLLVLQLRGEMEFMIGDESFGLAPRDILAVPANTQYSQRNVGLSEALSLSISSRAAGVDAPAIYRADETPTS